MAAGCSENVFQPGAGIVYAQAKAIALAAGGNADNASTTLRLDAVFNGVFHQRLENESRNAGLQRRIFNRHFDLEAFAEARLFNRQVTSQKIKLAPERDFL